MSSWIGLSTSNSAMWIPIGPSRYLGSFAVLRTFCDVVGFVALLSWTSHSAGNVSIYLIDYFPDQPSTLVLWLPLWVHRSTSVAYQMCPLTLSSRMCLFGTLQLDHYPPKSSLATPSASPSLHISIGIGAHISQLLITHIFLPLHCSEQSLAVFVDFLTLQPEIRVITGF